MCLTLSTKQTFGEGKVASLPVGKEHLMYIWHQMVTRFAILELLLHKFSLNNTLHNIYNTLHWKQCA
jgi:hypothetical protein